MQGAVEFVLIGGVAGNIHGSARLTYDMGVVYARTSANFKRIAETLKTCAPYLRGAPSGLPFKLNVATLRNGLNFTLVTNLGDLDLLGEVVGGGMGAKSKKFVDKGRVRACASGKTGWRWSCRR